MQVDTILKDSLRIGRFAATNSHFYPFRPIRSQDYMKLKRAVGKNEELESLKLESFPTSARTFQLDSFQYPFELLVFFSTAFSNYMYPGSNNGFSEGVFENCTYVRLINLQIFHTKNFTDISVRLFVWSKKLIFNS